MSTSAFPMVITDGASDENRTRVCSLEGCRSTIELHAHMVTRRRLELLTHWLKVSCSTTWATESSVVNLGWGSWIRTSEMTESKSVALPLGYAPITVPDSWKKWWRRVVSNHRTQREQIYSLPRLATSLRLHTTGADYRNRTYNLLITNQLLCQLS